MGALRSHDVFLSFRGEDTRKNFTDHLYTALVAAGFRTFRDNEGIERGENIKSELESAIVQSRCSIIVLSEGYSSSSWCLDELVMILDCKKKNLRHVVLPVFYHIDPSDVRKQKGRVKNAFDVHEERCRPETGDERKKEMMEKVKGWREALREVTDLAGMTLQNQADGHEAKFILKIVKVIEERLKRTILSVPPYLVVIDSRVKNINLWLQDSSADERIVAICGMGGIGKTTMAKYVFNLNFERFENSSFLANIREVSGQNDGLIRLQRQLLSDILKGKKKEIWNVDEGITRIKDAICSKRILLVLDDLDHRDQFEALLGMQDQLYPGSKIIITTRNVQLVSHRLYKIHNVEELSFYDSLELFSWHAFGQEGPADGYLEHSKRVVTHCGGLPLALKVLGSSLHGRSVDVWKSALEKLKAIPDHEILKKLVTSYDTLQDDHDKKLFLEIACFFIGKDKDYTAAILDECDFYTRIGIQNLMDRCLLGIDSKNKLIMHQLLQDMGREIIRQESPNEPGKRTRLWKHKVSLHVLKENTGTGTITGLALNMKMVKEDSCTTSNFSTNNAKRRRQVELDDKRLLPSHGNSLKRRRFDFFTWHLVNTNSTNADEVYLKTDAFTRMNKLSLLQINYAQLVGCYKEFPKKLRWLCWRGFPMKSVPSDFPLESLVAIDMRNSSLEQVWKRNRFLGSLKILNLSHSHELISTPNFSTLPQLEQLILKNCASLVEVHESIGNLETKLIVLNLKDCRNLRRLPRNICMLKVLETLIISGCSNLDEFPREVRKMDSLKVFHADEIAMNPSASTTGEDSLWHSLISPWASKPRTCRELSWASLPHFIVSLSLAGCNLYTDSFPMDLSNLSFLKTLNLSRNPICSLPDCIRGLTSLQKLDLYSCTRLQELIDLPRIPELRVAYCSSLEKLRFQLNRSPNAQVLYVNGWKAYVELEGDFKLETLGNIENEVLKSLHMYQPFPKSFEVKMYNTLTYTETKGPVQGLFQRGIVSIFLPGSKVPDWFSNKSIGYSVSITVPLLSSKIRVQGLNVCTVHALNENWIADVQLTIIIRNETKNLEFLHGPTCYGLPEADENMIWLSHWKFHLAQLDGGDELIVSLFSVSGFEVKEVGVHIIYDDQEPSVNQLNGQEIIPQDHPSLDFVPATVSAHRGSYSMTGLGFLGRLLGQAQGDIKILRDRCWSLTEAGCFDVVD